VLLAAAIFEITSISFRPVLMASGLMGVSSHWRWVHITITKAPRGGAINRKHSFFLDIVHVNIAFGDYVSVGGFQYSLIFIDLATCYNWVFGLKDLSRDSILSAFRLFQVDAGSYAWCFRCDCDPKLLGTMIQD
jgi:hypothetical protein